MKTSGFICLLLGAVNLVWVFAIRGQPAPAFDLTLLTNACLLVLGIYLVTAKGTPVPVPAVTAAKVTSNPLEAELASANRRLAELDAKHRDANDRHDALTIALRAAEAKAVVAQGANGPGNGNDQLNAAVVSFLSLLQRKGRFVDFLMDDITKYDDKQVGAAARIVHQGCTGVLGEYFQIEPVRKDDEGGLVTLDKDYNPIQYTLVGRVAGSPPFKGTLLHRGWRTTRVSLPKVAASGAAASQDIIQPAEVELT